MAPIVLNYERKIKVLFQKLLFFPESALVESYLQDLTQNFQNKPSLLQLQFFREWIINSMVVWEQKEKTPTFHLIEFVLKIASILVKTEENFTFLSSKQFFSRIFNIINANKYGSNPILLERLGCVFFSVLDQQFGLHFIAFTSSYRKLITITVALAQPIHLEKCGVFMAKFLSGLFDHDSSQCTIVIDEIMRPINANVEEAPIVIVSKTLEVLLADDFFKRGDHRVFAVFLAHFTLVPDIWTLTETSTVCLTKIICILQFFQIYLNVRNEFNPGNFLTSIERIRCNFVSNFYRPDFGSVLELCDFSRVFWTIVLSKFATELKELVLFPVQSIIVQLLPIYFLIGSLYRGNLRGSKDVAHQEFADKIARVAAPETFRIFYFWRERLSFSPNLFQLGNSALALFQASVEYCSRDAAVLVFQTLLYSVQASVHALRHEKLVLIPTFLKEFKYFVHAFNIIYTLIEKYQITWTDGVESLNVMSTVYEFLKLTYWDEEVVIPALKLINISIAKYMVPNLALLIDQTSGSALGYLGIFLSGKLQEKSKVVRLSTLEIVGSLTIVSGHKFPSLQKILLKDNLHHLVVKLISDKDTLVKTSAIKCVQEMSRVEDIWRAMDSSAVLSEIKKCLSEEKRSAVRKEAAAFLAIAFEHERISGTDLAGIYTTMASSCLKDIHWEVKMQGLRFWEKVIMAHLQQQGMIDGSFPDVTFSKERRKIVTLTPVEIKLRLEKVLNQLSLIGCLQVLVTLATDAYNPEVSKAAQNIIADFLGMLNCYGVHMAASVEANQMNGDDGVGLVNVLKKRKLHEKVLVTPLDFLGFARHHIVLETHMQNPVRGIEDFEQLLNDMLRVTPEY